jgi:hypothetical protein
MTFNPAQYALNDPQANPKVKEAVEQLCKQQGYGIPNFGVEDYGADIRLDVGYMEVQVARGQWQHHDEYPYNTMRLFARYLNHQIIKDVLTGGERVLHVWFRADLKAAFVADYEDIHRTRTRCQTENDSVRGYEGVCYFPTFIGEVILLE